MRWFLVFMVGLVVWSGAYAAELLVPGLGPKILAAKVQYLGIAVIPVAWLTFSAEYADLQLWSRRTTAAAFVLPVATILVAWSNEAHGLLWASVEVNEQRAYSVLSFEYGFWFWINVSYAYVCLLLATGLLIRMMWVRPSLFRRQAVLLAAVSLTPWLGNFLYVTGLNPTDPDLTVFGFAFTGFVAAWAVLCSRLLSIGPIGREVIVQGLSEGVIVIDHQGRIVDVNPAASGILDVPYDRLIGREASEALGRFAPSFDQNEGGRRTVIGSSGVRSYDCEVAPLSDRQGQFRGWTFVLHDATARVAEAVVLENARRVAEHTAEVQRNFMTNINHEIRTPLNGVLGMLEVLMTTRLDSQQRKYTEMAGRRERRSWRWWTRSSISRSSRRATSNSPRSLLNWMWSCVTPWKNGAHRPRRRGSSCAWICERSYPGP